MKGGISTMLFPVGGPALNCDLGNHPLRPAPQGHFHPCRELIGLLADLAYAHTNQASLGPFPSSGAPPRSHPFSRVSSSCQGPMNPYSQQTLPLFFPLILKTTSKTEYALCKRLFSPLALLFFSPEILVWGGGSWMIYYI